MEQITSTMAVALRPIRAARAQVNDQQRFSVTTKATVGNGNLNTTDAQPGTQKKDTEALPTTATAIRPASQSSGTSTRCPEPTSFSQHKRSNVSTQQIKKEYPWAKALKTTKFYTRQNKLVDRFLQNSDEERLVDLDVETHGNKIKFAIYASCAVNLCLFIIQVYAATSTRSLSLFAIAADTFVRKIMYAQK